MKGFHQKCNNLENLKKKRTRVEESSSFLSSLLGRHSWRALEIHKICAKISFHTLSCWRREVILLTMFGWKSSFSAILSVNWNKKKNQWAKIKMHNIKVGPIWYHPIYGCSIFGLFSLLSFANQIFNEPNVSLFLNSVHHSQTNYVLHPPFNFRRRSSL